MRRAAFRYFEQEGMKWHVSTTQNTRFRYGAIPRVERVDCSNCHTSNQFPMPFYCCLGILAVPSLHLYSTMSQEHVLASLPWGMVAEFVTFDDMLNARLMCHSICEGIGDSLSSEFCAQYLSKCLTARNMYFIPRLSDWKESATQLGTEELFLSETNLYFDKLLRVLRVLKWLPKSMAVAFNGKYGRHCLPLKWDEDENRATLQTFSPCRRGKSNCPTCRLKLRVLPLKEGDQEGLLAGTGRSLTRPSTDVHDYLEIHNKQGRQLDLHYYAPKCIPNLPNDLICPQCKVSDRRTLVLSEFSYKGEHGNVGDRPNRVVLSWTPRFDDSDDDEEEEIGCSSQEDEENPPPSPKRQKTESCGSTASHFPPRFDDMAIPIRIRPIALKPDCKFTTSIHCANCQEFGVFAPAGVCWNQSFRCANRKLQLPERLVGGALVRQKCSSKDCNLPISCPSCAHNRVHESYSTENRKPLPVTRQSHCGSCRQTFCDNDAWLSTNCHHS